MDQLTQGLFDFYAGQARVMLAQYEDINRLLGKTSDWTHPGTHCELLLRNFVRKQVLSGMSVDKGFVFGRVEGKEPRGHGPEIDILIHDTQRYRPLFRLDDFVIVQPESVLGMIQVKRTLRTGEDGALRSAICNVAHAKQHVIDVVQEAATKRYGDKRPRQPSVDDMLNRVDMFTAVVGFERELTREPEKVIEEALISQYTAAQVWEYSEPKFDTGAFTLPNFVGALTGPCFIAAGTQIDRRTYHIYPGEHSGGNVSLQLLAFALTRRLFDFRHEPPPFGFPELDQSEVQTVAIPKSPRKAPA